jgi:hypothetical protein
MFFTNKVKNKGKVISRAENLTESSRHPRFVSLAQVNINGFEGQASLKNVSIGGFCMDSAVPVSLEVGELYSILIKAEEASGLPPFEFTVEVRWIRSSAGNFAAGFQVAPPIHSSFKDYVEFLKTARHSQSIAPAS